MKHGYNTRYPVPTLMIISNTTKSKLKDQEKQNGAKEHRRLKNMKVFVS